MKKVSCFFGLSSACYLFTKLLRLLPHNYLDNSVSGHRDYVYAQAVSAILRKNLAAV